MSELDPIFSSPLPYGDSERVPISMEDMNNIRNLIDNVLVNEPEVHSIEDDEGDILHFATKEAEFKLPNGDRIHLQSATSSWETPHPRSIQIWFINVYTPLSYEKEHLIVQRLSFDFSPEHNDSSLEEPIVSHTTHIGEVKQPDEPSLLDIDLSFIIQALMQEGFHDILDIDQWARSFRHDAKELFAARYEAYALERKLKDALNIYGPEKHKWLSEMLKAIEPSNKVITGMQWHETYESDSFI